MSCDLILRGGEVVDGTGKPPLRADLAVKDGRISEVGLIGEAESAAELDVAGLWVCPGIIDIHSHSDFTLIVDPRAMSSVMQGVTLEVVGNCGHGCAPIVDPERARSNIYGCQAADEISWRTMAGYLERLEASRPAVNVLTLVPNGLLRLAGGPGRQQGLHSGGTEPDERVAVAMPGRGRFRSFNRFGIRSRKGLSRGGNR